MGFPLNDDMAYIENTGKRTTLGDKIQNGGGGDPYTLPTASSEVKGGAKIGSGLTMTGEVLSADAQVPAHTVTEAGKVLKVADDGSLEWDEEGSVGGPVYIGLDVPSSDLGEEGEFYMQYKNVYETVSLIPVQSNNTNVICSNEWTGGSGQAWHLFDGNASTYWSTSENYNTDEYCGFDFGENGAVVADSVGITPRQYSGVIQMHDFKLQASNDNETWTDLYTGTMPNTSALSGHMQYFTFDNSTAYRYYRLFVEDANTSRTITIFEMQLFLDTDNIINIEQYKTYKKVSGSWIELT